MKPSRPKVVARPRRTRISASVAVFLALAPLPGSQALSAEGDPEIVASAIPRFDVRSDKTRFGSLDYVGGFSYTSADRRLRGVSGIRMTRDRQRFIAVTDTGFWFTGRVRRDEAGRPTGIDDASIAPILGPDGRPRIRRKGDVDAEGLAIDGDRVLVSYERAARIESFALPRELRDIANERPRRIASPIPLQELRSNAGMEAIAVSAESGRTVVVTEQSIDEAGNLFAAIVGPDGGIFKIRRDEPWAATDATFLPDGDLLLLERRYEGFGRLGMRIRRIAGASIAVGALVDGPVLIEADLSEEIDNMEGLDATVGADGAIDLTLVSDDNGSFFQRNLFLEFRLDDTAPAATPSN